MPVRSLTRLAGNVRSLTQWVSLDPRRARNARSFINTTCGECPFINTVGLFGPTTCRECAFMNTMGLRFISVHLTFERRSTQLRHCQTLLICGCISRVTFGKTLCLIHHFKCLFTPLFTNKQTQFLDEMKSRPFMTKS